MALQLATSYLTYRQGGDNTNNGGYWDSAAGGTDYTDQDSPELTLTDLATDGAGTSLTSVTGGFTAAMVGNTVRITAGTGFTPGYYRIAAFVDTNEVTLADSAGAGASAGTGNVGGALAVPLDSILEANVAGMEVYFNGTITLTENISVSKDGTNLLKIKFIGYNATKGDNPIDANRPTIACGAFQFHFDNGIGIENLIITGTGSPVVRVDVNGYMQNLKVQNTSGAANVAMYLGNTRSAIYDCEAISDNGVGIQLDVALSQVSGCYIHDCGTHGIKIDGLAGASITNCIVDTCVTGIGTTTLGEGILFQNNTVYNCTTGFDCSISGDVNLYLNNDINSCTTGIAVNAADAAANVLDYNNYFNNTADVSNAIKGANATANDPSYTDATNGDFSNALDAEATPKDSYQGRLTNNALVQGAVQPASGGEVAYGSVT